MRSAAQKAPAGGGSKQNGDPVKRAQRGYKNNWARKEVQESQQVTAGPLPESCSVAIIGGGLSGLVTANASAALSKQCTNRRHTVCWAGGC
jgi:hypothetical protein